MAYDFQDDFEGVTGDNINVYDPVYTNFSILPAYIKISNDWAVHGTRSCKIHTPSNGYDSSTIRAVTSRQTGFFYGACRINWDNAVVCTQYRLYETGGSPECILVFIGDYLGSPLNIRYYSGGVNTDSGLRWTKNTDYKLKCQFNSATKKWSAWIKGGLFATWTIICTDANYFTGTGNNINAFYSRAFSNGVSATAWDYYFDGIAYGPNDEGYPYEVAIKPFQHWYR